MSYQRVKDLREFVEDYIGFVYGIQCVLGPAKAYYMHKGERVTPIIFCFGIKGEGESTGMFTTTEARAVRVYLDELGRYLEQFPPQPGGWTLVWRKTPEINIDVITWEGSVGPATDITTLYKVYSRFAVIPGKWEGEDEPTDDIDAILARDGLYPNEYNRNMIKEQRRIFGYEPKESQEIKKDNASDGTRSEGSELRSGSPESTTVEHGTT